MTTTPPRPAHTPGPWQARMSVDDQFVILGKNPRSVVATIERLCGETMEEANTRLIVAAPQMFSRLKSILEDLKGAKQLMLSGSESDSWMVTADGWDSLIAPLAADIAAAEGRA